MKTIVAVLSLKEYESEVLKRKKQQQQQKQSASCKKKTLINQAAEAYCPVTTTSSMPSTKMGNDCPLSL